jgi:hypothetical protein
MFNRHNISDSKLAIQRSIKIIEDSKQTVELTKQRLMQSHSRLARAGEAISQDAPVADQ